ncbi:MAG: transposase, partial [Flavobacteriales bacterium]
KFRWQEGYGIFSVSESQLSKVINYIKYQEKHHAKMSFKEEYIRFLNKHGITYNKKYVFK